MQTSPSFSQLELVPEYRLDEDRAELASSGAGLRAHLVKIGALVPRDGRELIESRAVRIAPFMPLVGSYRAGPKVRRLEDLAGWWGSS